MASNEEIISFNPVDKAKESKRIELWGNLFRKYDVDDDDPGIAIDDEVQFCANIGIKTTKSHKNQRPKKLKGSTDIDKLVRREYRPRKAKGDTINITDSKHEQLEDIKPHVSCSQGPQRSRYCLRSSGALSENATKLEHARAGTKRDRNNNSIQIKKQLYNQNSKLANFSSCASNVKEVQKRGQLHAKDISIKCELSDENVVKTEITQVEDASPTKKRGPARAKRVKTKRESSVEIVTENGRENKVMIVEDTSPTKTRSRVKRIKTKLESSVGIVTENRLENEIIIAEGASPKKRGCLKNNSIKGNPVKGKNNPVKVENTVTCLQKNASPTKRRGRSSNIDNTEINETNCEISKELQRKQPSQSFSAMPNANVRRSLRNKNIIEDGQVPAGDANVLDTKTFVEEKLKSNLGYKLYQRYCCQNDPNFDRNTLQFWNNAVKEEMRRLGQVIPIDRLSLYMKSTLLEWISQSNIHNKSWHE